MKALPAALIVLVACGVVAATPQQSFGQEAGPPDVRSIPPSPGSEPGASPSFFDFGGRAKSAITDWFKELLASALAPVFDLLGKSVFSTPHVEAHPRLRELWRLSLTIADASLVLLLLVGAGIIMGDGGLGSQITAKELLPRLLISALAANASLLLLSQFIGISSALAQAVFGSIDASSVAQRMTEVIFLAGSSNLFRILVALGIVALGLLVVVGYILRVAILVVLTAAGPLMLVTHVLPQTEGWARLWWRSTLAVLAAPVLQALLIAAALQIFLSPDSPLGLPGGGGLIDLLVVGCILYLLLKIPFWALNAALGDTASSALARAKRLAVAAGKAAVA